MNPRPVFQLEQVSREFQTRQGVLTHGRTFAALSHVTLTLEAGFFYGLVGGSGSGKTTLARLLAGLAEPTEGKIFFRGQPLAAALRNRKEPYWRKVQMIFQNPYQSLDPKWKIREILEEGLRELPRLVRVQRAAEALEKVGLKTAYLDRKPQALSGGERQRVAVARALAVKPDFLILDEPTSQLDVSVQAQILKLLLELKHELPGGMLFITHDLALVGRLADRLIVLSSGLVAEEGKTLDVLKKPQHDATRRLIAAIPAWGKSTDRKTGP